jgi:hypothetical protein
MSKMMYLPTQDYTFHTASIKGDLAIDWIHECDTKKSVWGIENESICKVKVWCEGRQLESGTINFVRDNYLDASMSEVICSSTDVLLNRTFLILKRFHARTLDTAWSSLLRQSALHYCEWDRAALTTFWLQIRRRAMKSSLIFEVLKYCFMRCSPAFNSTWLSLTLGPFLLDEMKNYIIQISEKASSKSSEPFHFYHSDSWSHQYHILRRWK